MKQNDISRKMIFYLCGIPFLIIRHHYKDDKIVIEVCAFG
ncbi:hypothetical protein T4C_2333 [Trichinella pseudospiralis]|uniref:Uncharacterized protein n=1 Tax=Trichinella pseudospiralis TaxID=6337 RepID=A0A0V1GR11_TRIPS|nr:hypothetical protein T4C_2333 [Trichinella pseudospiralis]